MATVEKEATSAAEKAKEAVEKAAVAMVGAKEVEARELGAMVGVGTMVVAEMAVVGMVEEVARVAAEVGR